MVDDEAAEVVRQIFREYLNGKPAYKIAQGMNESGVETPAEHIKSMVGYDLQQNYKGKILWSGETILRILRNETYVGTFVYHKYVQTSVGGKAKKLLDPSEWKRVENNHEAIIDRKDFDAAQKILDRNKRPRVTHPSHPLSYKVECGLCHHNMRHEWSGKPKFSCAHMYLDKGNWHERNCIRDEDLERILLKALQKQLDLRADAAAISEERLWGSRAS